jgi:hypothetical protein
VAARAAIVMIASPMTAVTSGWSSADAAASVTIQAPDGAQAGPVTLSGRVSLEAGQVTSVLYVVDATRSTAEPTGADCSGDGVVTADDDDNGDGSVGDVLDCEIAGVQALNASLSGKEGVQAGLVGFANDAATANLDPAGNADFVAPGETGGDVRPRIDSVARSLDQSEIGLYTFHDLGGSGAGTAFNRAIEESLDTLSTAPAGPKWVMFLSDGQSKIKDSVLDELTASGVRLRSFAIGADASCVSFASLSKLAQATGEKCVRVEDPAALSTELAASQPDAVNGVSVAINGVAVAAQVDAVGGWAASFNLGAGTYTATVTAVLASGATVTGTTTFTVLPGPGAPTGSVSPGPGALLATVVRVNRPPPSRAALPRRVAGRVGLPIPQFKVTKKLDGARVRLQARGSAGAEWTTVGKAKVTHKGHFVLTWTRKPKYTQLRVTLPKKGEYAASAAAVPPAQISACRVKRSGTGWSVRCQTTAKDLRVVRLRDGKLVLDTTQVHAGTFRLDGSGAVEGKVVEVVFSAQHRVRLTL